MHGDTMHKTLDETLHAAGWTHHESRSQDWPGRFLQGRREVREPDGTRHLWKADKCWAELRKRGLVKNEPDTEEREGLWDSLRADDFNDE